MSWIDLLRMSINNLKRRKLRTFLTVLGVIIGTSSIVVMISLGLGMQKSMLDEIEQYGGMTTITVTGNGGGMYMAYSMDDSQEASEKYLDDEAIEKIKVLDHVIETNPVLTMDGLLLKNGYESYVMLTAMTPQGLAGKNISLASGQLPEGNGQLELVYGNQIITNFSNPSTGNGYWETGELPDIDLERDTLFLILDTEGYWNSSGSAIGEGDGTAPKPVKKHVVTGCGMVAGGLEEYNAHSYNVYCDLDTLKTIAKKEFAGRAIPGQPQRKNGKPLKQFCYSSLEVKVDDKDVVNDVVEEIRSLGYNTSTNAEYMEAMNKQMAIVQAVLGGIGAVSLFVAAIGIANTMMMSIYERTKEIGVMKVLGCSLRNIQAMFLIEAAFIGFLGGVIGNIFSLVLSQIINMIVGNTQAMGSAQISYIPIWLVIMSIGFGMLVGVIAGYFPSKRAMKLSALDAIRNN